MKKWIGISALIVILVVAAGFMFNKRASIAYVDLRYLFDNFEYTKELKTDMLRVQGARQKVLDSMEFELKIISKELDANKREDLKRKFEVKKDDLIVARRRFEEDNLALTDQFDKKILTQLNQFVQDYGKDHGYSMIIGTEGSGNVMYAKEDLDISKDVLKFINNRFKGTHEK